LGGGGDWSAQRGCIRFMFSKRSLALVVAVHYLATATPPNCMTRVISAVFCVPASVADPRCFIGF